MGFNSCTELSSEVRSIRKYTHSIVGISDQFVHDIDAVLDQFKNNEFVVLALKRFVSSTPCRFDQHSRFCFYLSPKVLVTIDFITFQMLTFAKMSNEAKLSKIDVNIVKKPANDNSTMRVEETEFVDAVKILQAVLLKQLPAERISGIINIIYAMRPSASENEIENALVDYSS